MSIFHLFYRDSTSDRLGLSKVLARIVHKAKGRPWPSPDPSVTDTSSSLSHRFVVTQRDECRAEVKTMSSHVRHPIPGSTTTRYHMRSSSNTPSSQSTSEGTSRSASYESSSQTSSVSRLDEPSPQDGEGLQDISDSHRDEVIEDVRRLVREQEARVFRALRNNIPSPGPTQLNVDQFKVLKQLGRGTYGKVLEAQDRLSGKHLALKVVKKGQDDGQADECILMEQQAFIRNAGNIHTIQLAASFHDSQNFYLLMDIQTGGDLQQLIDSMELLPIELARFYAAELLVGIYELHARGIMHRDIKPANLLIDGKGHLLISDFGFAKIFEVSGGIHPYGQDGPLSQAPYVAEERCGTPDYVAPEILLNAEYGFSVDYWAAGITIFQMLVGHTPWHKARHSQELAEGICYASFPSGAVPRPARALLFGMLDKNPNRRPSYNEILASAFFDGMDWEAVRTGRARPPRFRRKERMNSDIYPPASVDFGSGEAYSLCRDPFPFFTWMSDSMEEERTRITVYKLRTAVTSRLRRCFKQGRKVVCATVHNPKICTTKHAGRRRSRFVIEDSDVQVRFALHHLPELPQVATTTRYDTEHALVSRKAGPASTDTEKESEVHAASRLRWAFTSHLASPLDPTERKTVMAPSIGPKKTFRKWINRFQWRTSANVSFDFVSPFDL
ncbi:kinase-like domain-containing protein [Pisolithus marmoratus]|nr:kinase-like domain-containing protein [Pisolithus marmoratus]